MAGFMHPRAGCGGWRLRRGLGTASCFFFQEISGFRVLNADVDVVWEADTVP